MATSIIELDVDTLDDTSAEFPSENFEASEPEAVDTIEIVEAISEISDDTPETLSDESVSTETDPVISEESQTAEEPAVETSTLEHRSLSPALQLHLDRIDAINEVNDRIIKLTPRIQHARVKLALAKEDAKSAKDHLEGLQEELENLAKELTEVQSGEWQRSLPFEKPAITPVAEPKPEAMTEASTADVAVVTQDAPEKPARKSKATSGLAAPEDDTQTRYATPEDIGASHPVSALGMSDKETELLENADIATVGMLEEKMRANAWWYREIKGFGPSKVDKLMDKLLDFRKQFPVPANCEDEE